MHRLFPVSLPNLSIREVKSLGRYRKPDTPLEKPLANKHVYQCRAYRDCKKAWVRIGTTNLSVGHKC